MATPATRHFYDPSLGADFAEDLCDDHAAERFLDDPRDRYEVSPADPGTVCGRCEEEDRS